MNYDDIRLSDLNMSHGEMSDFVSVPLFPVSDLV